jgi:hypothetical protein
MLGGMAEILNPVPVTVEVQLAQVRRSLRVL